MTIKIFSPEGEFRGIVDDAESVQLTRRHRSPGSFAMQLPPGPAAAELCREDAILLLEDDPKKAVLVRDWEYTETPEGRVLQVRGVTPQDLARRRIVVPPSEQEAPGSLGWERVSGTPEAVFRHFVEKHLTAPRDPKRAFPNVELAEALGLGGDALRWQARFEPLSRVLEEVCAYADLGYRVEYDAARRRFVVRLVPGTDRTQGSGRPVVFSPGLENTVRTSYRVCFDSLYSTGYAGGQGEDEKRLIQIVGAQHEGWARTERFLDAGGAATLDELLLYGNQQLGKQSPPVTVGSEGVSGLPFRFETDYELGDRVSFTLPDIPLTADTRIVEVTESWEPSGKRLGLLLGAAEPNLLTALRGESAAVR